MAASTYKTERDVESNLLAPLFRDILKYPDSSLHWAEPVHMIFGREKKTKEADLVVYHDGVPVVTVEAKSPKEPVQSGIGQVDSYAFALKTPYSVVTNGRQFVVRGYYSFNSRINVVHESVSTLARGRWARVGNLIGIDRIASTIKEKAEPLSTPDVEKIKDFRRFFRRIHSEIRDRDKIDPAAAFDEFSKILFLKAAEEDWLAAQSQRAVLTPEKIREWENLGEAKELIDKWFKKAVKDFFSDVFEDDPRIRLKLETMKRVLEMMRPFNVRNGDVDVKGRAFEEFLPSQLRGKALGQFFTPRPIVDFMVEMAGVSIEDVVVDFSCGSGGFLIKAFETMSARVEQLPAGIIKKMGTTKKAIMDAIKEEQLFGIDAEPRAARTAKMNMLMWGDGRRVVRGNGLDVVDHEGKPYHPSEYDQSDAKSGCTLILANPPFGATEKEADVLERYALGARDIAKKSERTEVLFLEKGLRLLRPEGRILIVLPQGIFQTSSDQRVRDFLHSECEVRGIVSLPTHTFVQSGVSTIDSCVVYLQKFTVEKKALYDAKTANMAPEEIRSLLRSDPDFDYPIFMGSAEFIGFEPSGRAIVKEGEKTDLDLLLEDFEHKEDLVPPTIDLFEVAAEQYGDKSHKKSEQTVRGTTRGLKTAFSVRLSDTEDRLDPAFYLFRHRATALLQSLSPLGDDVEEAGETYFPETDEERDKEYRVLSVGKDGVTEGELRSGWEFKGNYKYQRVKAGDIAFNPSRVNIGSIGAVPVAFDGDLVSPEYVVFRSKRLKPEFLVDLFRSPFYRMYISVITTGSIRNRLYFRDLKDIRVPEVSAETQRDVVERGGQMAFILESARRKIECEVDSANAAMHALVKPRKKATKATSVEDVFRSLVSEWRAQTGHLSSVTKIAVSPAYQQIIGMGEDVVPLILGDLFDNGTDHWFWALSAITRQNPITEKIAGDMEKMREAWLEWARKEGYPIGFREAKKTSSPT